MAGGGAALAQAGPVSAQARVARGGTSAGSTRRHWRGLVAYGARRTRGRGTGKRGGGGGQRWRAARRSGEALGTGEPELWLYCD